MPSTKPANNPLLKILGVTFGIAVTVGGTIGGGILRKPGAIAAQLGDPWLIMLVWTLVGLYAFLGVLCTIELGTSVPQAGAWYVYARRAFGDYAGFLVGLTSWLGSLTAMAFNAYTMSEYIALLLPAVAGHEQLGAVLILTVLAALHWIGLALASQFQNVMSFLKALGLLLFVLICFVFGRDVSLNEVAQTTARVASTGSWIAAVIFSLQAVFYTYDGWHSAAYFAEEDKDPVRNLPRSMIGGVSLIIVIYLLVNAAILYVLPMPVLQQSKLAAADAITALFGPASGQWVTFFLMISILGIVNAQLLFNPRVLYSMSRDGLFIRAGERVNRGGTPSVAMPLTALASIGFILSGKETAGRLSDIATFFFVLSYCSGFAAVLQLRWKEPHLPRPWKSPGYPVVPWALLLISIGFLAGAVWQDLDSSQYALVFLALSYPLFRAVKRLNTAR